MVKTRKTYMVYKLAGIIGLCIVVLVVLMNIFIFSIVKKSIIKLNNESRETLCVINSEKIADRLNRYRRSLIAYSNSDIALEGKTLPFVEWMKGKSYYMDSDFKYILFAGRDGAVYSESGETDINISDRDYYIQVVKKWKDFFVNDTVSSRMDGDDIIPIAKAVYDKSGKLFGEIIAALDFSVFESLVENARFGSYGFSMIIDSNGLIVASSDKSYSGSDFEAFDELLYVLDESDDSIINAEIPVTSGNLNITATKIDNTPGWLLAVVEPADDVKITTALILRIVIIATIAMCLLLVTFVSIYLGRSLRPLEKVAEAIGGIASGDADLTKRIELSGNDEIGRVVGSFNTFVSKLQEIISSIKNSKDGLSVVEGSLQSSIENTSSSITTIVENISNVTSQIEMQTGSVNETTGSIKEIALNIDNLKKMIQEQSASVTQASASVEEMISNISSVNKTVEKMAAEFIALENDVAVGVEKQSEVKAKIDRISEQSEMLMEANAAIENIASQTNMLAMNAAIEAAHAGDAGRGFSVVADEIRKLSETSSEQSHTIGDELRKIMQSIEGVVTDSVASEESFGAVSSRIKTTDVLVRQIRSAMDEQNDGSRQIFGVLQTLNTNTSQVRSSSEEMAAGSQTILAEVKKLQDATEQIKAGMENMGDGTGVISQCEIALTEVSAEVKSSVRKIGDEIDLFKV